MPAFGAGSWRIGGDTARDPNNDDAGNIAALRAAADAGVTHIDTAELYADGYAEELIAQAIADYDRHKLFLVSKVKPQNLAYGDLIKACEGSLRRLKTDYLDLYLIHWINPEIPLAESFRALNHLKEQGKIKNIGVSNFGVERMNEARKLTPHQIVANQVHYNLLFREVERKGLLEYCQKEDIMLVAWRPVQKGIIGQSNDATLESLCQKYGKTKSQIAIQWLVAQKNVVTLSTMRSASHLEENLAALDWQMEASDIELLRSNFSDQRDVSDVLPLG